MIESILMKADTSACICDFDDPYDDYIVYCNMEIYGIPEDLPDIDKDDICRGSTEKAVKLGTVTGMLVLGSQAEKTDMDIYEICDSIDGYAEHIYSALSEDNGPLGYNPYYDFFCISDIEMQDEYNEDDLKLRIIESLPEFLLCAYHVFPDIIAVSPEPLEYEKPVLQEFKERMAVEIAAGNMDNFLVNLEQSNDEDYEDEVKLMLDEDQFNYLLGRRVKGESYPESAKDKEVWELYSRAGFYEHLNTRVLFQHCHDNCFE